MRCPLPTMLSMKCKNSLIAPCCIRTSQQWCRHGAKCYRTIWPSFHPSPATSNAANTMEYTPPPKKSNSVSSDSDPTVKNTNARCHPLSWANVIFGIAIKWTLHRVSLMVLVCTDRPKRRSIRCVCSAAVKLIFGPVHGAPSRAVLVRCIQSCCVNIIALLPFYRIKIQHGAMQFYSLRRVGHSSLKFNTSRTMNFCRLFWANKLSTKKVYGKYISISFLTFRSIFTLFDFLLRWQNGRW